MASHVSSISERLQSNTNSVDSDDEFLNIELTLDTREAALAKVKKQLEEELSHFNPPETEVRSAQILELVQIISEAANVLHFDLKRAQIKEAELVQIQETLQAA